MAKKDLFEDIVNSLPSSSEVKAKRPVGRPKSSAQVKVEQDKSQKEFIENYESKTTRRPEPKRMIVALSLPEELQKQALEDAMNPRQLAYCKEYPLDFNMKQAAIRAGYSMKTAALAAYNLMQYRGVNKLIEIYTQSQARKITNVDKDYIIQKVTEIVTTASKDSDKLRGLELLARHLGMFVDRTEITGKDGDAIRIEETKKEADEVARTLRSMAKKTAFSVVAGGKD